MNSKEINKFLLRSTVACMALLCVFVPIIPIVDVGALVSCLLGIGLSSAVFLLYFVLWDKRGRLTVKTQNLPGKVLLWGTILAGMSFMTKLQVKNGESPVAQSLMIFTIVCLACAVVLAGLLWLTTEPEGAEELK